MAQIVPAILEKTPQELAARAADLSQLTGATRLQVDFADGRFVPNELVPIKQVGSLNPLVTWEAHLMCESPKDFLDYQLTGFTTIIVHYEAYPSVKALRAALAEIKTLGLNPGVCLKLATPTQAAADVLDLTDHVQLMAIEPGFQGAPFHPEVLRRIAELRFLLPRGIIEVDGGVSLQTAHSLARAGADLLVAGSAIVRAQDPQAAFDALKQTVS